MERVAIYCRVSTQEQAQEGYSIGEQETRLTQFCEAHSWSIYEKYIDAGFSGSSLDRPKMQKLIADAKKHKFDKVLVYKLDRLSRSQKDTLYLIEEVFIKNSISFVSMTETLDTSTPFGMAIIGILSVFAQLERATIKERMMMGRDARVNSGKFHGKSSNVIGYRYDGEYVYQDEYEASIVKQAFERCASGESLTSLYLWLANIRFRDGKWSAANVKRMLQQPLYIGYQRWKKQLYKVENIDPIISEELWNDVQIEIKKRSLKNDKPKSAQRHVTLFGGMVWCGCCGRRMYPHKTDGIYRYYCVSHTPTMSRRYDVKPCENIGIRDDYLNQIIIDEIKKLRLVRASNESNDNNKVEEINAIESRIKALNAKQEKLIDLYSVGTIDIESVKKKSADYSAEITALEEQIEELKRPTGLLNDGALTEALNSFDSIIAYASDAMELYSIVRILIKHIVFDKGDIAITWNFNTT